MKYFVYVTHYTPLKERKESLTKQLEMNKLNYKFIENYDKESLSYYDLIPFDQSVQHQGHLRKPQISLFLKHIKAYELISKSNNEYSIVFEDDVLLHRNFMIHLENGLKQLPEDYDMLVIGEGNGSYHIPSSMLLPNKLVYKKCLNPTQWGGDGTTRGTDAYVISKKCATIIANYFSTFGADEVKLNIDWWLNEVCRIFNFNVYWLEPTIIATGSVLGIYKSSISSQ